MPASYLSQQLRVMRRTFLAPASLPASIEQDTVFNAGLSPANVAQALIVKRINCNNRRREVGRSLSWFRQIL